MNATARCGATLLATVFVAACATAPKPHFELTGDCRLRSLPWSQAGTPSPGAGFGFGVGSGSARPEARSSASSDSTSDAPASRRGDGYRGGGFGAGFGLDIGSLLGRSDAPDFTPQWLDDGPGFADSYSNSCMPVRCFVKGGWPMVIDYTADGESLSTIEVHIPDAATPLVINLDNTRGRHLLQFALPASLGHATKPAVLLVRSMRNTPGTVTPGYVQIHGLGAGPRAVGSVAIERVDFQPPLVQRSARQQASYSFLSKSDFNHVAVSVLRVDNVDGQIKVNVAREFRFEGGINSGTVFGQAPPRLWDGTDAQNKASLGSHLLQVRAWMSARDEADWVTAWSERAVRVAQ
jgi:hypothetical protein